MRACVCVHVCVCCVADYVQILNSPLFSIVDHILDKQKYLLNIIGHYDCHCYIQLLVFVGNRISLYLAAFNNEKDWLCLG